MTPVWWDQLLVISGVCEGVTGVTPSPSHYLSFTLNRRNGNRSERARAHARSGSPVSGLISSSSFTMPSPCMEVQCLMGEPPPILLYCSWIFGVRRLAMKGPSLLQSQQHTRQNVGASPLLLLSDTFSAGVINNVVFNTSSHFLIVFFIQVDSVMKRVGHSHSGLRWLTGMADAESKYWKTGYDSTFNQLSLDFGFDSNGSLKLRWKHSELIWHIRCPCVLLHRKLHQVRVHEEPQQEVVNVLQLLWSSHVQHQDTRLRFPAGRADSDQ